MIEHLCVVVVGLAGTYLAMLGVGALVAPAKAARFLLGFASTQTLHFVELLARVVVGAAFVIASAHLSPPQPFLFLGWVLLGTSTLLLLVPWQWHRRFASSTVPMANRHIGLVGLASLVGGLLVLVAVFRGAAT
jgi:hypothetical protein